MRSKTEYQTKQRDELLAYLERVAGQHITVRDISEYFQANGKTIGITTVYRQLEKMVNQGIVTKYAVAPGSPACFEYVGAHSHVGDVCYHCKCELCGKVVHLHCDEIPQIRQHIREEHGFTIDPVRTVFYGICENCSGKG